MAIKVTVHTQPAYVIRLFLSQSWPYQNTPIVPSLATTAPKSVLPEMVIACQLTIIVLYSAAEPAISTRLGLNPPIPSPATVM